MEIGKNMLISTIKTKILISCAPVAKSTPATLLSTFIVRENMAKKYQPSLWKSSVILLFRVRLLLIDMCWVRKMCRKNKYRSLKNPLRKKSWLLWKPITPMETIVRLKLPLPLLDTLCISGEWKSWENIWNSYRKN